MVRFSSSAWRASRGDPQAGQRVRPSGVSARQSRQKVMTASRHLALPRLTAEGGVGARHVGRILTRFGGEGGDQPVVGGKVAEHAGQEVGLGTRLPNLGRAYAGRRKEAPKPLRLA